MKIPVRHTSNSSKSFSKDVNRNNSFFPLDDNYSDDFDGSEKEKPDQVKSSSKTRSKSPTETSTTSTAKSDESFPTKTWQIIFHTSNIPTGSFNLPKRPSANALLKFSFISIDGKDETEPYVIRMKDFPQCFKSARQDSFRAKLRSIGQPKQIRLNLEVTGADSEDIKWHLDHVNSKEKHFFYLFLVYFRSK